MERALLEGEHQDELEQLHIDQEKIASLKRRQVQLIEHAAIARERVRKADDDFSVEKT